MNNKKNSGLNIPPIKILFSDEHISFLIRPLEEKDAKTIYTAVEESKKILAPFLEWAHQEWTEEKQALRLRKAFENYYLNQEYELGVFSSTDHQFLMAASWTRGKTQNNQSLEIGFWTHLDHCCKGFATCVTKILIVSAFDFMNCDRVEIRCRPNNLASKKVIENCGFHFEGKIRNYFNEPSKKMIENGFNIDRSCLQYSLIADDVKKLAWYLPVRKKMGFISKSF